jgi:thiamine biosynthesis lipoprotein
MGSTGEITAYCADRRRWQRLVTALEGEARRIETKYSRYRDDSVTSALNRAAGGTAVPIDSETAALLRYADACHRESGGRFDITSGVLRRAWDFRAARLPDPERLAALVARVGWHKVRWSTTDCALGEGGMEIDFGGVGKEYAVDRLASLAAGLGETAVLINLGGDVRAVGPPPDGRPWRIGIPHPRQPERVAAELALLQGAVATSGDYERYFERDGRRYCHILDPHSGWPVEGLASVTVLAPVCVVAGSLATLAMLHGPDGNDFLRGQGVPALTIDGDGQCERLGPLPENATGT